MASSEDLFTRIEDRQRSLLEKIDDLDRRITDLLDHWNDPIQATSLAKVAANGEEGEKETEELGEREMDREEPVPLPESDSLADA